MKQEAGGRKQEKYASRETMKRTLIRLVGAVQGVGFRPFVYNLARKSGLKGYVTNDTHGVLIDVEGEEESIREFVTSINENKPPLAQIFNQEIEYVRKLANYKVFEIRESCGEGKKEVFILPDMSTCDECYAELTDPENRRFRYPFINCTHCGPRFTIIENLPYDRPNTTMKSFEMCPDCRQEYEDPENRRFHAQPNACSVCGPHLSLCKTDGTKVSEKEEALKESIRLLKNGSVLAIKGVGGFHLACDATSDKAIRKLRERKKRAERPFAVMFKDLEMIKKYSDPTKLEENLVKSHERPVVLVSMKEDTDLSSLVAPFLKKIGVFLPYSPLHFILLHELNIPLVMTSANLSDEPIVKDNDEAFERLKLFCDYILLHNRNIRNHSDDSVVRVFSEKPAIVRRSRGYAPMSLRLPLGSNRKLLAVGGHQRNVIALGLDDKAIASQHIGDLETYEACNKFEEVIEGFLDLYDFRPDVIIHDLHPTYHSTKWARSQKIETVSVQHHYAHALSVMADNDLKESEEILAITWDGTGYGTDGNLWGGEFLLSNYHNFKRLWHFDYFKLIGGEKAVKEPRRVALSLLFHLFGRDALKMDLPFVTSLAEKERGGLFTAWEKGINTPYSSSVGRLFDAVASILDIKQVLSYEGQSGMIMEDMYDPRIKDCYPYEAKDGRIFWQKIIEGVIEERKNQGRSVSKFINTLARVVVSLAEETGKPVGLSGGVFQNKPLVEKILKVSEKEKIKVYLHKKVPPNDGGLFLGQLVFGRTSD